MPARKLLPAGMPRVAVVVGVTKPGKRIQALSAAALALPGMIPKAHAAPPGTLPSANILYSRYQECCDRIDVDVYEAGAQIPLGERAELAVDWVTDVVSGSSPVVNIPESRANVISGASGGAQQVTLAENGNAAAGDQPIEVLSSATIRDTRHTLNLDGQYSFDQWHWSLGAGASKEKDYRSYSINLAGQYETAQKMRTLGFAFAYTSNEIEPIDRRLTENNSVVSSSIGVTQILDKSSLFDLSFTYSYNSDFLSNPYKKVFIQGAGNDLQALENTGIEDVFFENRPDKRHQYALSASYVTQIAWLDAALHIDYTFHADSWGIRSHAFEASLHQPIGENWMLVPRVRYYSQTQADFYRPFFTATRSDGAYSSDYRLSGFGSLSGGLTLTRKFFEKLRFEASFEYYQHKADYKLGGDSQSDFADFSYTLITAGLRYEF